MSDWLIIGTGNRFRCDDAVGPLLADRLAYRGLKTLEHSGEGTGLINSWAPYRKVLLIDATSSNARPGTIHRINAIEQDLPIDLFHYSSHQFGIAQAIEMARTLAQTSRQALVDWYRGREL